MRPHYEEDRPCMPGFARTRSASRRCSGRNCRRREPKAGEVLIAINAASLNFPDLLIVQNKYQIKPPLPFVPGSEYAGVVEAVGEGVDAPEGRRCGRRLRRHRRLRHPRLRRRAALCMPLPPGFAFDDAAAFIMTYGTTHHALIDRGAAEGRRDGARARRGRRRRHGGDPDRQGGRRARDRRRVERREVRAVQVASAPTRPSTTRSAQPARRAEGSSPTARARTSIYDPVGGDLAEPVFRSIAWRGRYLVVGFAQGGIPALPLNLALLKGASIVGVFWGDFARREPKANAADAGASWRAGTREGKIKPVIDRTCRWPSCRRPTRAWARAGCGASW